jgi:hypothetical protein
MTRPRLFYPAIGTLLLLAIAAGQPAGGNFRYPEGKHAKGELRYRNGIPVLTVEGTPEEMGEQLGVLGAKSALELQQYFKELVKQQGLETAYPLLIKVGKTMEARFPPDHLTELNAAIKASGVGDEIRDLLVTGNVFWDIKGIGGCSALVVEPSRSANGGMLFGRNFDMPTFGVLDKFTLVTVYRPKGKHAFVCVGFPGLVGVPSGMNDAGLALAALDVRQTSDGSARFNAAGTPYPLLFRRVLEECTTVAEAEKLLRDSPRTTMLNLSICDKQTAAVFEMTTKTLNVRPAVEGLCACTNHFRTKDLAVSTECQRFDTLKKSWQQAKLDLHDVAKQLDAVNQGAMTVQTMVFEPNALKLHLAIGPCPTSALPLKELALGALFQPGDANARAR